MLIVINHQKKKIKNIKAKLLNLKKDNEHLERVKDYDDYHEDEFELDL